MKHKTTIISLLAVLFIIVQACRLFSGENPGSSPTVPAALPQDSATAQVETPAPSETPVPSPTGVPSATTAPLPSPTANPADPYTVIYHPDGGLMVGDLVSMEVIAPPGENMSGKQAVIKVDSPDAPSFGPVDFGPFGIAGRTEAVFTWSWNTASLQPGNYSLNYSILPDGPSWTDVVTLAPADPSVSQQQWETLTTDCCSLNFITGSDAHRDIEDLADLADQQAQTASERLQVDFSESITITLIPRVLGHGGFAGEEIYVTYSDNNYMGSRFDLVLLHEMIHILDGKLGGEYHPSIFVEGLAVYLSGGHFKPAETFPRAAALLQLQENGETWYIPLRELANAFYASQHEIGYLEGAALIEYMVDRWGWEAFDDFYRTMKPVENGTPADAIDKALKEKFGVAFEELEAGFLAALRSQEVTTAERTDLELTVRYYDTARRYQVLLDSSAYFATAWLMDGPQMRERGITADYARHPTAPINQQIEARLMNANNALLDEDYEEARRLLDELNSSFDAMILQGQ